MGRFFNEKIENKRFNFNKIGLIAIGVIFLIILIIIIRLYNKHQSGSNIDYELNSKVAIEIGSELPNVEDYFKSIENDDYSKVSVDTSEVNIDEIGTYDVTITIGKNVELVQVVITDTTAPTLTLRDLTINSGTSYNIIDFVDSCEDNSGEICTLYYAKNYDENSDSVDQSSFTENGVYEIKIYASDDSGNSSEIESATLTIGDGVATTQAKNCTYGSTNYDTTYYTNPLAVIVANKNTNCAVSYTEWNKDATLAAVDEVINNDYTKLKNQVESNTEFINQYPNGAQIVLEQDVEAVLNNDSTGEQGLVGYSVYMTVYIGNVNDNLNENKENYLKIAYYINNDGTRTYTTNAYGIE